MPERTLDVEFCRAFFLPFSNGVAYFENAGGSYVPRQVIDGINAYMAQSQCQPSYPFASSRAAGDRLERSQTLLAESINADSDEIVIGPNTTLNVYVLAHALAPGFAAGDEIVVTNQDHEANGGAWRRLAERGVVVREWRIDPISGELDPADLAALLGDRTRLVCFPHVSNVVGSVNDVDAITRMAHAAGAMVCVDGVATVAHHLPDVKALGVDFYLFSLYKLFGPHLGVLYGKRERIAQCANQNHFFHEGKPPATLNPGGLSYESVAGVAGIFEYFDAVYDHHFGPGENDLRGRIDAVYELFRAQEARVMEPLLAFLSSRDDVRVIGSAQPDAGRRAPTISITVAGRRPAELAEALAERGIAVGSGHFYAHRCVEALGIEPADGVLRFSMTHYNSPEDAARLIEALAEVLG